LRREVSVGPGSRLTVLVSGMIAGVPGLGGATWAVLQYVLGLARLGHRVYFVEPVAGTSLRPDGSPLRRSSNRRYFEHVMSAFGLREESALLLAGTGETIGLPYEELRRVATQADLLVNLSGALTDAALFDPVPVRAYVDLDPAFTQLWAEDGIDVRIDGHTHLFTVGMAIGDPQCPVPTGAHTWEPILQPVVLDHWPAAGRRHGIRALTTVAHWRGYGSVERDGVVYGQRAHSFRAFFSLPSLSPERFLLALAIHPDEREDLAALGRCGWGLTDPARVAGTPAGYRRFVRASWAEFGVAKSGYVLSRSGWFSDRSACYLASGRPVVAQDTGFSRFLPTGEGLFAFRTCDEALAAIEDLRSDYALHAGRARELAGDRFDSDKVLPALLDRVGAAA
jgi:hypothetical protein